MGQKIHPIGLRLGIVKEWESKWYAGKDFPELLVEDANLRKYIRKNMQSAGVSRIEIERAANKVKVNIHTARPGILIGRAGKGIDDVRAQLERLTKGKTVHVNVIEIKNPETDAQLVAESIAQQIEKRISYKRAMKQSVLRAMKMGAKGIKIRIAGRLGGAEMARVEHEKSGKVPLHTLRADIDYGFYEAATTYGNIGIKVWIYKGDIFPSQMKEKTVGQQEEATAAEKRPRRPKAEGARRSGRSGGRSSGRRNSGNANAKEN
ncbi:MAG: 30S ribosomal protein S3 [Armatimonadota bacterium]